MLTVIEKVSPETLQILKRRFQILDKINRKGPIGRRALAVRLGITERILRKEVDVLKEQELITISNVGMEITSTGVEILRKLKQLLGQHVGLKEKETQLAEVLNIDHCVIVPGNSTLDSEVLSDLAHESIEVLDSLLPEGKSTVAVMGGTTMLEVASVIDEQLGTNREILFVPARGGLGESVNIQANAIAERMAQKTHGRSRALHAPEHVRSETYSLLLEEPEIKETLKIVESATLVLYSIGGAFDMANRRGLDSETLKYLKDNHAVAEAFGEFVNPEGEIVHKLSRIGLQSSQLGSIPYVVAIAGGKEKAEAIKAHIQTAPPHTWLVTDEAAANEILNGG